MSVWEFVVSLLFGAVVGPTTADKIVQAVRAHDALVAALKSQACNPYRDAGEQPCWCRSSDRQLSPGCQNQPQCVQARDALAEVEDANV